MGIVHVYALYASGYGHSSLGLLPTDVGLMLVGLLILPAAIGIVLNIIRGRN